MTLSDFGNFANVVTALTAIVAVSFAGYQTMRYQKQQLETVARSHYQDFLRLSIEYPEFFYPDYSRIDFSAQTFDGDQKKFLQYDAFFWTGMNALESLFYTIGDRASWKATIASVLDFQAKMLASQRVRQFEDTFEPEFREFLQPWLNPNTSA